MLPRTGRDCPIIGMHCIDPATLHHLFLGLASEFPPGSVGLVGSHIAMSIGGPDKLVCDGHQRLEVFLATINWSALEKHNQPDYSLDLLSFMFRFAGVLVKRSPYGADAGGKVLRICGLLS